MSLSRRVIVFGDVIDDILVIPTGAVRYDTDTSSRIRRLPGGSAANVASWLGSQGVAVDFIGCVGAADVDRHAADLRAVGVTPHLAGNRTLPTGTIVVLVDGEVRTMFTERGANVAIDPEHVSDTLLDDAALMHLTGYSVTDAGDPHAIRQLIARARDRGVAVSIDPGSAGFLADYGPSRFLDAIDGATVLFPSLDEARLLTGESEPRAVLLSLAARFEIVALTMGRDGVLLAAGGAVSAVPAVTARVTDPTGAGDAFDAGFIASWISNRDAERAARSGVILAARAVASVGGRPAPPGSRRASEE